MNCYLKNGEDASGNFKLETLRNRNEEFESQIIKKSKCLSDEIDGKIISLFALGSI